MLIIGCGEEGKEGAVMSVCVRCGVRACGRAHVCERRGEIEKD